jgi:hypothetical protein
VRKSVALGSGASSSSLRISGKRRYYEERQAKHSLTSHEPTQSRLNYLTSHVVKAGQRKENLGKASRDEPLGAS